MLPWPARSLTACVAAPVIPGGAASPVSLPLMGAWDVGSFDNDSAADWAGDLVDGGSPQTVIDALEAVANLGPGEGIDSDLAVEAIAAAEVVAAAAGRPGEVTAYSERALAWAAKHDELGAIEHRVAALAALDRIVSDQSELRELWLEDADGDGEHPWLDAVAELRKRVAA